MNNLTKVYKKLFLYCLEGLDDNYTDDNILIHIDKTLLTDDEYDELVTTILEKYPEQIKYIDNPNRKYMELVLNITSFALTFIKNIPEDLIYKTLLDDAYSINYMPFDKITDDILNFCKLSNIEMFDTRKHYYDKWKLDNKL